MKHGHKQSFKHSRQPPPFRAFTTKYSGIANRLIHTVELSHAFDPNVTPPDQVPHFQTQALWDTGATKSVITNSTVATLNLAPVGITKVNHAGGVSDSNTYLINVFLPNHVVVVGVLVSECHDIPGNVGAIIGMDIIASGDLSITNVNKQTWMTFRYPSYKTCDYVVEFNRIFCKGIPPYAPCPCGKIDKNGKPVTLQNCHGKDI